MASDGNTRKIKLAICGPTAVGKSALVIVFLSNNFPTEYDPTIEDSFTAQKEINGCFYLLEIVDTAGAEEYVVMQADWMRACDGFVIVYSIVSKESFLDIDSFHDNIIQFKNENDDENMVIPMVLAGNKNDLESHREVPTTDGQEKSQKWGCKFFECSAKANTNVQAVFAAAVESVVATEQQSENSGKNKGKKKKPCIFL